MIVLGIETSCDETAAAIVEAADGFQLPWRTRSSVVASQVEIHREWGGVVPEIASRQHVRDICGVVERALGEAGASWPSVDAVAVTQGPGLVGSLLVGVSFAKTAAWAAGKPLVGVNHLAGHIESLWLEHGELPTPAIVLVVSGGHTSLYLVPEPGVYRSIGRTRDDAAGEAYDKVAKLLGLGYPGGPIIDRLAADADPDAIALPSTRLTHPDRNAPTREYRFDFSFSGLKTAVLRHVRQRQAALGATALPDVRDRRPRGQLSGHRRRHACRTRVRRSEVAQRVVGWHRRRRFGELAASGRRARPRAPGEIPVFFPSPHLSTDNAAMIAAAGMRKLAAGALASPDLNAQASLPL